MAKPTIKSDNLRDAAIYIRNTPEKQWNFEVFIDAADKEKNACGSHGCALGNLAMAGICGMPQAHLTWKEPNYKGGHWSVDIRAPDGSEFYDFFGTAETAFGLTEKEVRDLFLPIDHRERRNGDDTSLPNRATREMVAERMLWLADEGRAGFEDFCREQVEDLDDSVFRSWDDDDYEDFEE